MNSCSSKVSFELFPPKTVDGLEKLKATVLQLNRAHPLYYSITFGAGGSVQNPTLKAVQLLSELNVNVVPHITCVGTSKETVKSLLDDYQALGIQKLVVLRGDLPSGFASFDDEFKYAADLVHYIRNELKAPFDIAVGAYPECHPQAKHLQRDLQHFNLKINAGANKAITQYFYNIDAYRHFVKQCRALDITAPIVPGIMPITNVEQLTRFSKLCGAEVPQWIIRQLESYGDDKKAIQAFGVEVVTMLCENLLAEGVEELHFYTLNRAEPCLTILDNLGLL
jgi:methylenetetrahydrofolate reductase (NADPH)